MSMQIKMTVTREIDDTEFHKLVRHFIERKGMPALLRVIALSQEELVRDARVVAKTVPPPAPPVNRNLTKYEIVLARVRNPKKGDSIASLVKELDTCASMVSKARRHVAQESTRKGAK